jgi:N,N-dimethylformamidase beta subunit-like protein
MLSTGPARDEIRGRIEFFRIGHHPGGQRLVWTSPELTVSHQLVSQTAASVGANWPPSISDIDTRDWPPGYYSADFVEAGTGVRDIQRAQIVVLDPRRSGAVLLRLGTNTYQAYNAWGGHSLYPSEEEEARGSMVSFDRPTTPGFFEYEVYLARWLEALGAREGFAVDYASNFDVHRDPTLIEGYPLVISGSHDEYWSKEEFDAFERRIFRLGGNTAFFGANAAYFQVRYIDVNRPPDGPHLGRQLLTYKSFTDPIARRDTAIDARLLVTARFREGGRRPESMLMGVAFQNWFSPASGATYPYRVTCTDMPFFEGTGWKEGDVAAHVVGYEWDNRDPAGDGNRLWSDRSCNEPIPAERLKVLFEGTPVAENGQTGRAEAVYFESPAGAKVFSAGSVRWAWGLGKPGFENGAFRRFNENLVRLLILPS